MKFLLKHWLQAGVSALCVSAMIVPGFTVHATENRQHGTAVITAEK